MNNFYTEAGPNNYQICRVPSCLRDYSILSAAFLLLAILLWEDCGIFIGAAVFAFIYGFLEFRNDRIIYSESGITIHSIWGKPHKVDWHSIVSIDVVEEQLISKQYLTGRVLRIETAGRSPSKSVIYRYPYLYYNGIDAFVAFYESHVKN